MIYNLFKNGKHSATCKNSREFVDKANMIYNVYCQTNGIEMKEKLRSVKGAESFLKSQDYDIEKVKENEKKLDEDRDFPANQESTQVKSNNEFNPDRNGEVYFTKIKVKGVSVDLEYSVVKGDDVIKSTLPKDDEPKEEFARALQQLISDVVAIGECPKKWEKDLEVLGISLKYCNNWTLKGLTISVLRRLENSRSPMSFSTPFKVFEDTNDKNLAPYGCKEKVEKIIEEAHKYLKGERKNRQRKLGEVS